MFFTSGIIIAFFCFAFYLIWNQFLKKDTRLSTGLQLLRKKINELENLSVNVSAQMDRQMSLARDKVEDLELLLKSAKENCEYLENLIQTAQTLGGQSPLLTGETSSGKATLNHNTTINENLIQKGGQSPLLTGETSSGKATLNHNTTINENLMQKGGQSPLQKGEQVPLQDSRFRGNDEVNGTPQQKKEQNPVQIGEQANLQAEEPDLSQMEQPRPVPKPKTTPPKPQKTPSLQFGESPFTNMDTGMDFLDGSP